MSLDGQSPISSEATLPLPKDREYATIRPGRRPLIKYQTKGAAKLALNLVAKRDYAYVQKGHLDPIEIYALSFNRYVKIFDSDSMLANLYRCGALTYEQMVARIFE